MLALRKLQQEKAASQKMVLVLPLAEVFPHLRRVAFEDYVALLIFFLAVSGTIVSYRWERMIPKLFHRELLSLDRKIMEKKREAEKCDTVDQFHIHGKLLREIAALERRVKELQEAHDAKPWLVRLAPQVVTFITRFGFWLPCVKVWGSSMTELVMVPNVAFFGMTRWLFHGSTMSLGTIWQNINDLAFADVSVSVKKNDEWIRSISVGWWCVICIVSATYVKRLLLFQS